MMDNQELHLTKQANFPLHKLRDLLPLGKENNPFKLVVYMKYTTDNSKCLPKFFFKRSIKFCKQKLTKNITDLNSTQKYFFGYSKIRNCILSELVVLAKKKNIYFHI